MAKHYKKYNADNKNKSQNIIKKHLCLHGITRPQVAFLNYNMFAANHHDKIAPPPTPLRAPHHHRQELPNARHHEHNDTLFPENPPTQHITQKRNHQPQQHTARARHTPPTHNDKKNTQTPVTHQKSTKKMAEIRHFLTINRPSRLLSRPASGCFYGIICNF